MTTWRVSLSWDRSIFHDVREDATVPPVTQAYQAWAVARPVLLKLNAEGPERFRDRMVTFDECEFVRMEAELKSRRVA
jgi:hypothetical protein